MWLRSVARSPDVMKNFRGLEIRRVWVAASKSQDHHVYHITTSTTAFEGKVTAGDQFVLCKLGIN